MKDENKILVICTPGFPSSETDTTCLPMQQALIRSILQQRPGLKIVVLAFQYPYHTNTYQWFGTTVIPFNGQNKGGFPRLLLRRKINAALKKIHTENTIVGILSFWYGECAYIGKKFAAEYHLPHYCWILGQDARAANKYPRKIKPVAGELLALSDFIQDEFAQQHGIRAAHVIPPGIDPNQFSKAPTAKDIDIIAVGSLIPLKQYGIFIQLLAALKEKYPDIKAVLIGDGVERNNLEELIRSKGLGSNITLTGELAHAEVLQYMQRGKIFLHPSSYEGFGVVMIEALQAGCNVISFCKPMKKDIEQWHIVQSKEEMLQKAIGLLGNPAMEYNSVTPFTLENTAKKIVQLFIPKQSVKICASILFNL